MTEYRVQHYTECSIHRVQHTCKIVRRLLILTFTSLPLNVASASGMPPYRSTATSQLSLRASDVNHLVTFPPLQVNLLKNRVSAPGMPPIDYLQIDCFQIDGLQINRLKVLLQSRSIIASQNISKFALTWPRSASLSSPNYGLHVYLQDRLITASKCILQAWSITASECISVYTQSSSSGAP
jgi:hypothetical protein